MARVRTIRHRVVAGSVALFVAIWLLIAITLVSGHDPALARQTGGQATTSAASANTSSTTTSTSAATAPTSTPSSVTTRQS